MMLEDRLEQVCISPQQGEIAMRLEYDLLELTTRVLHDPIFSIGSSARATYVPNQYGLPIDFDYYIKDCRDLSDIIAEVNTYKSSYESLLSGYYGCLVEIQLVSAVKQTDESTGEVHYRQARYQAVNASTSEVLICLDFNYDECLRGDEKYNDAFKSQLETLVSRLPLPDREIAQDYLLANIRALKAHLSEQGIYKTKEGGFGGLGCEQLLLQLHAGKKFTDLGTFKKNHNMGTALERVYNRPYSLHIHHPVTGEELIDAKLSRHEGEGWKKILSAAKDYEDYLPASQYSSHHFPSEAQGFSLIDA